MLCALGEMHARVMLLACRMMFSVYMQCCKVMSRLSVRGRKKHCVVCTEQKDWSCFGQCEISIPSSQLAVRLEEL